MNESIQKRLSGGHHNSLGNTVEVVEIILENPKRFDELFNCYFCEDELVRLRVSSAMKRIAKAEKSLIISYIDRILERVSQINQASTQWTLASLFLILSNDLERNQKDKAIHLMKNNLLNHMDWIVLNTTMETLFEWSKENGDLRSWLIPVLEKLQKDERRSVSKRATKYSNLIKN